MAIRVHQAQDTQWISVERDDRKGTIVAISRDVLDSIVHTDPRPPEIILDILCDRALKRMPVPNSADGQRLITTYNLSLVWPT